MYMKHAWIGWMTAVLLVLAGAVRGETEEGAEKCMLGFSTRAACCTSSGWHPGAMVPLAEVDSVLLMPDSCAIPPFCLHQVPQFAMDAFRHQEDTFCAPHIDAFNTSDVAFIICKNMDDSGRFLCYGRTRDGQRGIDFTATPPTPCFLTRGADDGTFLISGRANACRVNVRLYDLAPGETPRITSTQPLTFRPILQPELAPFRGEGSTRLLLKRDTSWLGELPASALFVDAMLPACATKEDTEFRLNRMEGMVFGMQLVLFGIAFVFFGSWLCIACVSGRVGKLEEETFYRKLREKIEVESVNET